MEKKPYTKYFLPNHDLAIQDAKPERTRDPLEIEARRSVRGTGSLVLQRQGRGIETVSETLKNIEDPELQRQWAGFAGGAMLMSANYMFERDPVEKMNHALDLPELATQFGDRTSPDTLEEYTYRSLASTADSSYKLANRVAERAPSVRNYLGLARRIGQAGLMLAVFPWRETSPGESAFDIQMEARASAMQIHDNAIALGRTLEVVPSVMQLADHLSPLSVHAQRTMPTEVHDAYIAALEVYGKDVVKS